MLQDVRLLRIHNFLRRSFDHAIGSAMLLHPLCSTLHSGTWSAGSDGESIIIHFSLTSSRSFAIIQSNQKSPLFPRFFWISHERCISSVWFSTVQTVVLRLKVFWCELSTTRIGISSESSANDLKQQVLVTSELWKASSYGTKTTFPSDGTGPTKPSRLRKPWQVPCQAAVTVLLEPKRKDFLEMMVTCPESDLVSGECLFRNCELGVPAWSQLFFQLLSFVVRENQ